jgi:hypothetical protein
LKRAAKKFLEKIISTEKKAEKVISNSIANKIEELRI